MASHINILLTSFSGLGLPPTLSFTVPSSATIADVHDGITERLPPIKSRLIITTNRNKQLLHSSTESVQSLLTSSEDSLLPLRLSAPLCGGKGGFGSQLRAAGGRMSSRKKRKQGEEANASSRNLDGRRLRTVTEAKALAEYLAIKPEMDKKEREERRQRWESILEAADKREEEIKNGRGRLDGQWVEAKEEASERTKEAVLAAMKAGTIADVLGNKESDSSAEASDASEGSSSDNGAGNDVIVASSSKATKPQAPSSRTFFGWDEEDEDMSDVSSEEEEDAAVVVTASKVKGKGKAAA